MLKLLVGIGLAFLWRTKAVKIVDVDPIAATLSGGTLTLDITWHTTTDTDFIVAFRLDPSRAQSAPLKSPSQIGLDVVSSVKFDSISPGTYNLSTIQLDSNPPGKTIPGIFTSITVLTEPRTLQTALSTSSAQEGSEITHTNVNSPPFGESTSSQASPTSASNSASQNIGRIVAGPVAGVVVLIILVAVSVVILRRRRKGTRHPTEPAEVSPYPKTTSASNVMRAGRWQPVGVLPEAEVPTGEEASSSIGNDCLLHQEDRQQDIEIGPPMGERRVIYHNDSGWRPSASRPDGSSSIIEMPPRYDTAI